MPAAASLRVEAVCLSTPGVQITKPPVASAFLGPHGFVGDRHEGEFVRTRRGRTVANRRQWSAVSVEDVTEICEYLGIDGLPPGFLGENLLLSGQRLRELPDGAVLELPSGACLLVAAQNQPCVNAACYVGRHFGEEAGSRFLQGALGRRGIVGSVLAPGEIATGDRVRLLLPGTSVEPGEGSRSGPTFSRGSR